MTNLEENFIKMRHFIWLLVGNIFPKSSTSPLEDVFRRRACGLFLLSKLPQRLDGCTIYISLLLIPPLWSISTQTLWHTWCPKKLTNKSWPKFSSVGPTFPKDMTWEHMIVLSLGKNDQKTISRHRVCRLLVNERMHRGSRSMLKVTFFGHPVCGIFCRN